ncbi:phosphotransferase [Spongiactinospora sp. TRM90649]|uniref:phosphotransferase family protein n=1 Tax=Spongiactinospora sp. TRM90649 TaxID=3031114 RepID=UPI0023F7E214|nr:phosphotransferase [Spongiactinospora sp. TRM90649]MDF5756462.1 phosphotransferase [Spongiactinospora sp. TRM90649]
MIDRVEVVVGRYLPGYRVRSVVKLGEGLDNLAYEVNGELVVRGSREPDPEAIRREAEVLGALREWATLPVPEPVFAAPEAGFIAYGKLPGTPLQTAPLTGLGDLAAPLGEFLARLHRAPIPLPEDRHPMEEWLAEAEGHYRKIAGHLPASARRPVERFLQSAPPAEPERLTFCHNDLGAEHILVADGAITGVIDWTDAARADPAVDFALILRDLGPGVFENSLAHYDGEWDGAASERAAFYARCALLEDIAYGLAEPSAARYADAGIAHLARTF